MINESNSINNSLVQYLELRTQKTMQQIKYHKGKQNFRHPFTSFILWHTVYCWLSDTQGSKGMSKNQKDSIRYIMHWYKH